MFAVPSLNRMRQGVGWMIILGSTLLSVYGLVGIAATPFTTPIGAVIGVIVGLFSVIAPIVATWSPRVAARIYLWIAPTAPLLVPLFHVPFGYGILGRSMARWNPETATAAAAVVFVGSLVIPCFFWRLAVRRGWPGSLAEGPLSRCPKPVATVGFVMFIGLSLVALLLSLNFPWRPIVGDCGGGPLLSEGASLGLDFTASVFFVGPRSYRGQSLWSVVRVDHLYSPKAWAMPNLVILRGGFRVEDIGRQYFVEGQRSYARARMTRRYVRHDRLDGLDLLSRARDPSNVQNYREPAGSLRHRQKVPAPGRFRGLPGYPLQFLGKVP
jgi:hypothetical protein